MPWFKVDDGWWSHPKTLQLSDSAQALWLRAGSWSMKHLTDGVIPNAALTLLGAKPRAAGELVSSGMWLKIAGGYRFHDWDRYQPSREKVEQDRAEAAERMREVRANKTRSSSTQRSSSPARPNPTSTSNEVQPPRFCSKHPDGTDDPCRACGRAREARADWDAAQKNKPTPGPPSKKDLCPDHPDLGYRRAQCPMH